MKSSRKVGPLSPIRENKIKQQPAAHDRLLAILQQEEERDVFRAQTLKALEVNNPERIEEMKRIFAKERREANKVMEQILSDFKPSKRKSEPVTPLSSKERREKYNKSTPKSTRNSSNKGGKSFFHHQNHQIHPLEVRVVALEGQCPHLASHKQHIVGKNINRLKLKI